MQFQSDILDIEIIRPKINETTALGAAFISGLAIGFYKNIEEIEQLIQKDKHFYPMMDKKIRNDLYSNWQKAIKATRTFK